MNVRYRIRQTHEAPPLDDSAHPSWSHAETLQVDRFHERSADHRPVTKARLLHNADGIFVSFDVADRYVRCVYTNYQDPVCRDACVEWFVIPKAGHGYFNFETNCGGTLLLHYQRPTATAKDKYDVIPVDPTWAKQLGIHHTMPKVVDPEIEKPTAWRLSYFVPFSLFENYVGPVDRSIGTVWRANFYKCASNNSHPHWASWSPIGKVLNYHQPQFFEEIEFGE